MGATKKRGRPIASRHLVCGTCSSWLQFDTLGCTIPWAEMKGSTVFKCKGCTEVARLVGEVEDLRKMVESLKRMVTGQGLEETSGETGDREATVKEAEEREKCVGEKTAERSSSEDRDNDIEMEGEHGTEEEDTGRQLLDGKGTTTRNTHACNAQVHEEPEWSSRKRARFDGRRYVSLPDGARRRELVAG